MSSPNLSPEEAHAQLTAIHRLMARATLYRALSAPTALVAGLLSLFSAGFCWYMSQPNLLLHPVMFVLLWFMVLTMVWLLNTYFLWESSRQRREPFFTPSFRLAMASFLPPLIAGGVLTFWILLTPDLMAIVLIWHICYGLALLGTQAYAPRSLVILGWAFLLTGLGLVGVYFWEPSYNALLFDRLAFGAMGLSFGLFHLLYALATWRSNAELFPQDAVREVHRYEASSVGDDT